MSGPITWRNVNGRSDSVAASLLGQASDSINNAFTGFGKVVDNISADRKAEYDYLVKTNDQSYLDAIHNIDSVDGINNPETVQNLENLRNSFDGNYTPSVIRGAVADREQTLKDNLLSSLAYDETVATHKEKPIAGYYDELIASKQFATAREEIPNADLRGATAADLLRRLDQAEKAYNIEQGTKAIDNLVESSLGLYTKMPTTQIMARFMDEASNIPNTTTDQVLQAASTLRQNLTQVGKIDPVDQNQIDKVLALHDQAYGGAVNSDYGQFVSKHSELPPLDSANKVLDAHKETLKELPDGKAQRVRNTIRKAATKGLEISLDDGTGKSQRIKLPPAYFDAALSQIQVGTLESIIPDFEGDTDVEKFLSDLVSITGMKDQIINYNDAVTKRNQLKKGLEAEAYGGAAPYSFTQAATAELAKHLPKQEQEPPLPEALKPKPKEEVKPDPAEQLLDAARQGEQSSSGRRSGRSKVRKKVEEPEKDYSNNPLVLEAKEAIKNAPTARAKAMTSSLYKAKLEREGISLKFL
jgi:hypothetical protein